MKRLQVMTIGRVDELLVSRVAAQLGKHFAVPFELHPVLIEPQFAFHAERSQFHSSELLARIEQFVTPDTWRLLGITEEDLYIPILTFVFGEAQLGGKCTVVSAHRLRQSFYGLPEDEGLLEERLLKEAVHELGHTLELTHCDDYQCAMASSHSVEWIDLKSDAFCAQCASRVFAAVNGAGK